jgi:hypothetical protein
MQATYTIKNMIDAVSSNAKKRNIYSKGPVGGIKSLYLKLFFLSLPFIEYAIIFNPVSFNYLGIAQAIIFFIVFSSLVMFIIFLVVMRNNRSVFKRIEPSWNSYFPDVDLKMVLSSGVSPYQDFFNEYAKVMNDNLDDASLHTTLKSAFERMQEENRDLLEAIEKDKNNN